MSATGIIVEFNPFHNGHKIHIDETRQRTGSGIIAAMSGNFVQRGEPAICDKWRRTKMALLCRVDIVVEIPVPYVVCGADYFARGSVGVLAATGVVDAISFGSECGDLAAIMEAGKILAEESAPYKKHLRDGMDNGLSFASAKGAALAAILPNAPEGLLNQPNNVLAMEYCKALHLLGNPMEVFTTHRQKGGASATKIRKNLSDVEGQMPKACEEILLDACEKGEVATLDDFSDIFRYLLYTEELTLGEGLQNRFRKFAISHKKISHLLADVKTKRYTHTRLQRMVLQVLLGINDNDMANVRPPYVRVLGFRKEAEKLLGEMTKKASVPVITHGAAIDEMLAQDGVAAKMLAKELEVGDIYRLATSQGGGYRSERGTAVVVV